MKRIEVVAGILKDESDRYLIAERLGDGPFHGMWEFPGGKIDASEDAVDALARELDEELGIEVQRSAHFMRLEHDYPDRAVGIEFFLVERWAREPRGMEGQRLRWVTADELPSADLLPADEPVITALASATASKP